MKKLLFFILVFYSAGAFAQEGLTPLSTTPDSTGLEAEKQLMLYQLLHGNLNSELFTEPLQLPEFNFKTELMNRWDYNIPNSVFHPFGFSSFVPGSLGFSPSPFIRNAAIFSAGKYQLSDKFSVGGFSYGANSIFSAPLPNQGINNFNTHGATMFMQYKVSKNFKIETHINVQQGP